MELTIAEVSGLIAAGVFVLQLLLSLIFPAALVGFVNEENTAVTWSVLGRSLQSSPWPTLLQTDAAARHGVRRRVSNGLLLQTVVVLLISVAAIVTPLGLYQTVEPGDLEIEAFQYVGDDSPFGYGTPARITGPFGRSCGLTEVCPGSWMNETCRQGGRNCTLVLGRSIPDLWRTTFREGASQLGRSVSSIFDIQWRSQVNASDGIGELGWYIKSGYRQIGILILEPTIQLVDGLIVDAEGGGIGFRNHTAPAAVHEYGSTWTEDVLFIEPETQCVDLNITLDFRLSQNNTSRLSPRNIALTDRGGFSGLARTSPDLTIPKYGNGQGPLDLRERAYKAAWANNYLTLAFFNATDYDSNPTTITRLDVTPGMKFRSEDSAPSTNATANNTCTETTRTRFPLEYQAITSTLDFGNYLQLSNTPSSGTNSTENPYGIRLDHFNLVSEICTGGTLSSRANMNSSIVGCGLLYGAARRTDGGSVFSPQPGSEWSVPMYSCAASVRASIRTVTFQYNGTGLAALQVTSTTPKTYPSPDDHPLWAVEDMPPPTKLDDTQPLWGLLGASNTTAPPPQLARNLTTTRQPTLRLPGVVNWNSVSDGLDYNPSSLGQNIPGVDFYVKALQNAFSIVRPGTTGYEGYADYSGMTGLAMYHKWQNLSATAAGAAEIVNLVWTDIAANSVVGTKGWGLDDPAAQGDQTGWLLPQAQTRRRKRDGGGGYYDAEGGGDTVPVTVYRRRVRYQLPYMVPAIVVLVLAVGVLGTWLVLLVLGRTGPAKMRRLLDATSPGRILGGFLWPGKAATLRGTDEWVKTVGTKVVIVGGSSGGAVAVAAREGEEQEVVGEEGQAAGEESIQLMSKDKTAPTAW